MPQDPWRERMARADELSAEHNFAADILRFYIHIAEFQRDFYLRIQDLSNGSANHSGPPELSGLLASFPDFLSIVQKRAPVPLQEFAVEELRETPDSQAEMLSNFWTGVAPANGLEEFAARAFLQPYAEFVRSRAGREWDDYNQAACPFCSRRPGFGILRQQGDGGRRSLTCSFCLAEWPFRRIVCAACGEENHSKLPVFTAAELPHVRVECCDTCKSYIKTVDLTKNGLAVPLVDEMAAIPLDLWAQERGYQKLQPNLMQM